MLKDKDRIKLHMKVCPVDRPFLLEYKKRGRPTNP